MPEKADNAHTHLHGGRSPEDVADMIELLDLDSQVTQPYLADVMAWITDRADRTHRADRPANRIVDIGTGTGAAALAFAGCFPDAEVIAIDAVAESIDHLRSKAAAQGLSHRIRAIHADLDHEWPDTGPVHLAWASMSLHHLADPEAALRRLHANTTPGGLLAVVEVEGPLRVLPDDLGIGRPGLERRLADLASERAHQELSHLGADWEPMITAAGYTDVQQREFVIDRRHAKSGPERRYAALSIARMRRHLADAIEPEDRATLDVLLDPNDAHGIQHGDDLHLSGTRTLWLATRP